MRYVSIDRVTEGMVLGKPFYGRAGQLMLNEGVTLTGSLLQKIRELSYSGLYIKDDFSEGIVVKDIISDEIRNNTTKAVQRLMLNVESKRPDVVLKDMREVTGLINKIVDEITSSDQVIVNLIDLKVFDLYTYQHSVNVCMLSGVMGVSLGLKRDQLFNLALAAILHDLGKTFISKDILNKPGKLTDEEFNEIKSHSVLGHNYIKENFSFSILVQSAVLQHHERHDGSGYPNGTAGDSIPLFARIIALADVYDAITSRRPYHEAILPSEAYEYILGNAGRHFDPELSDVFVKKIAPFPLGMNVRLSNGLEGIVYQNRPEALTRPVIKLLPLPGQSPAEERFLDLLNDPKALNIIIQDVLT